MTSYVRQVGGRTTSIVNKAYRGCDRGRTISIAAQIRQTLVTSPHGRRDVGVQTRHRSVRQVGGEQQDVSAGLHGLATRVAAVEQQLRPVASNQDADVDRRSGPRCPEDASGRSPYMPTAEQSTTEETKVKISPKGRRRNRAVNHDDTIRSEQLAQKVRELEVAQSTTRERANQLATENDALNKRFERLKYLEQLHTATVNQSVQAKGDVRAAPRVNSGHGGGDRARQPGNCWTCGEVGHFSRWCPHAQVRQQSGQYQQFGSRSANSRVAGTSKGFQAADNRATYLRARVKGKEHECLLDSGSEVSLLPVSAVHPSQLQPTEQTLTAANGTKIPVQGKATVSFSTPSYESSVVGLVSDHVIEVMLGIDWLTDNNAAWDFQHATVRLGGSPHKLIVRQQARRWYRRVVLQEDVVVPPRSQIDLPCKVVFNGRPIATTGLSWGTSPASLAAGVHVASTLIPDDQFKDVPVRVMNVYARTHVVCAGTVVGNLEPLSPVSDVATVEQAKQPPHDENTSPKHIDDNPALGGTPEFVQSLVDDVDGATPESSFDGLRQLLTRYRSVFSESDNDLDLTDIVVHHIDTGFAKPIRQQLRRYPPAHVEAISTHVDNMLKQGVIEPASSPWASNIVLVRKKDGTFRCCIDYRQLNNVTVKDAYPLPRIDGCLDSMAEAKWFSTFDLKSFYH